MTGFLYLVIKKDIKTCTIGLWDTAKRYIQDKHIQTEFFQKWNDDKMFYNNFEVSSLDNWNSKQYREYIDVIDQTGGIYNFRWGDAPIKSIAVPMFVPENRTVLMKEIGYKHQR
jgi:hypothetical protein